MENQEETLRKAIEQHISSLESTLLLVSQLVSEENRALQQIKACTPWWQLRRKWYTRVLCQRLRGVAPKVQTVQNLVSECNKLIDKIGRVSPLQLLNESDALTVKMLPQERDPLYHIQELRALRKRHLPI